MAFDSRPRERLEKDGVGVLSTSELLAVILKSGTKKENVLDISNRLLSKYGLKNLPFCSMQELSEQHGIGKAKASQIVALCELGKRFGEEKYQVTIVRRAHDVAEMYLHKMKMLKKEQFVAVYLDNKNQIITDQILTVGILNASLIHPREVFHGAIKHLAACVIVLHNHPSGDPTPSKEDLIVTKSLDRTGKVMGIPLLDHIIIGREKWWSWKESG